MKRRNILFRLAAAVCFAALAAGGFYLKSLADYRRAVREISIQPPPLSQLADGAYIGQWDVGFIAAKVEVAVQGGRLQNIRILEHKNGRGQAAEAIVDQMLAEQRVDVDAVAGATNSSKVLQKAVEQALRQEPDSGRRR